MSFLSQKLSTLTRFVFLISFLCGFTYNCLANLTLEKYALHGIVRDAGTGESLVGAHVFLLESTLGTITNEEGLFVLSDLPAGEYKVGVSMIGYSPYTLRIDVASATNQAFNIELEPQIYELEQVTVTGKRNRRWKKQLEQFKLQVIGDTENAFETHIVNPEVLSFIQRKNILIAKAEQPLIIENRALGYRIHYTLIHCAIQHERPQYKGIARFEEMEPKNKRQRRRWQKNREEAYKGSFRHLLRTLARGTSMEDINKEGFYIAQVSKFPKSVQSYEQAIDRSQDNINELVQKSEEAHENLLNLNNFLLITFSRELESDRFVRNYMQHARRPDVQRSSIELKSKNTTFHDEGFLYDAYDVVLHGYMAWERMAEMLPLDYNPIDG